jgi:signal transduction histidine kinase
MAGLVVGSADTLSKYEGLRQQLAVDSQKSDTVLELSNEVRLLTSRELIDTQRYLLRFEQTPPDELRLLSRQIYDRQMRYLKLPLNKEERFLLEHVKVLNARTEEQLTIAVYLHALGRQVEAREQMQKAAPQVEELQSEMNKLISLERLRYSQITSRSQATSVFLSKRIIGIVIAMAVLGLLFTALVTNRVLKPILALSHAAERVGKGELGISVPARKSDEVGILAATFNQMSQSLKESHSELNHSNQQLKIALDEKEDFLRAVSHDLGAPLRNISGLAASVEQRLGPALTSDARTRLDRIRVNAERELSLISELLELSRIKRHEGRIESVDTATTIKSVLDGLSFQLEEKHIRVVLPLDWPVFLADRTRIRRIFQNLIENATKYIGNPKNPTISLGWDTTDKGLQFFVRDNGLGIKPDDKQSIFYVFRRGDGVKSADGKGIGLATVKSIVETYGGEIWVESTPGLGSTFYFRLNVATEPRTANVEELSYVVK